MPDGDGIDTYRRRRFLAALGAAGTGALAGCGSTSDSDVGEPSDKDVPPASVTTGDRWESITPDSQPRLFYEGSTAFVDYTAHGHVKQYEDTQLRQRIRKQTFGEIDRPFAVAFAARLDIFPDSVSALTGLKSGKIDSSLRSELQTAMKDFGVQNIQQAGTTSTSTKAGEVQVIEGAYPLEEITIEDVDIPHSDRSELTFGGGTLPIKGIIGRWKSDGSILAGGGVYPDGNFDQVRTVDMSEAISLSVSIDLGLSPTQLETDVLDFIDSVSL